MPACTALAPRRPCLGMRHATRLGVTHTFYLSSKNRVPIAEAHSSWVTDKSLARGAGVFPLLGRVGAGRSLISVVTVDAFAYPIPNFLSFNFVSRCGIPPGVPLSNFGPWSKQIAVARCRWKKFQSGGGLRVANLIHLAECMGKKIKAGRHGESPNGPGGW